MSDRFVSRSQSENDNEAAVRQPFISAAQVYEQAQVSRTSEVYYEPPRELNRG